MADNLKVGNIFCLPAALRVGYEQSVVIFPGAGEWARNSALVFCTDMTSNTPFVAIVTAMLGAMKVTKIVGTQPSYLKFGYKTSGSGILCAMYSNAPSGTFTNVVVISALTTPYQTNGPASDFTEVTVS